MAQEKNFENKVKAWLKDSGAWFIKYWAGTPYTKEGIPDILACINGVFYGIEIKAPNGKPTVIQLVTLCKIREAGGKGILLYPKDWSGFISNDEDWYRENIQLQERWYKKLTG